MNILTYLTNPTVRNVTTWYKLTPTQELLFDHNLPDKPTIWEVGGYLGTATDEFIRRYPNARVSVYEPIGSFVDILRTKFGKKVTIHPYGLGGVPGIYAVADNGQATSLYDNSGIIPHTYIRICHPIITKNIDLMMMNIEGSEYDLLKFMIDSRQIKYIKNLVVQFHTIQGYKKKYDSTYKRLSRTHTLVFRVPFVWEKWRLK